MDYESHDQFSRFFFNCKTPGKATSNAKVQDVIPSTPTHHYAPATVQQVGVRSMHPSPAHTNRDRIEASSSSALSKKNEK